MPAAPGSDRDWLRPISAGERDGSGGSIGSYRGAGLDAFNVPNPQRGFHYHWTNITDPQGVRRKRFYGFEFVTTDHPEGKAWHGQGGGFSPMPQRGGQTDSRCIIGSVALMRQPEERYRAQREEKARLSQNRLQAATDDFRARGEAMQHTLGSNNSIYHVRKEHGYHLDPNLSS